MMRVCGHNVVDDRWTTAAGGGGGGEEPAPGGKNDTTKSMVIATTRAARGNEEAIREIIIVAAVVVRGRRRFRCWAVCAPRAVAFVFVCAAPQANSSRRSPPASRAWRTPGTGWKAPAAA